MVTETKIQRTGLKSSIQVSMGSWLFKTSNQRTQSTPNALNNFIDTSRYLKNLRVLQGVSVGSGG